MFRGTMPTRPPSPVPSPAAALGDARFRPRTPAATEAGALLRAALAATPDPADLPAAQREGRAARRITARRFAVDKLGVSVSTYERYVAGRRVPEEVLRRARRALSDAKRYGWRVADPAGSGPSAFKLYRSGQISYAEYRARKGQAGAPPSAGPAERSAAA